MPCFLQRRFGLVMAMSVALALLASPVPAEGQLDIVAKFEDADLGLDVVTYTKSGRHGIREQSGIAGFQVEIGAHVLCLQSQGVGVATRSVDESGEGAIQLLECRRLVDGDENYGPLSSHGECRARGEVHRHISQGSKHYLRACECRYGSLRKGSLPSEGFSLAKIVLPIEYKILPPKRWNHDTSRSGPQDAADAEAIHRCAFAHHPARTIFRSRCVVFTARA